MLKSAVDDSSNQRLERMRGARAAGDSAYLVRSLADPDNRHLAALYLADLRATEAIPEIRRLLGAGDPLARANAARALGKLSDRGSSPCLRELATSDPVPFVRGWAVGALGEVHDEAAAPTLAELLRDSEWQVRVAAAYALGRLGAAEFIPAVRAARRREGFMHLARRRAYSNALRELRRTNRVG